MLPEFQNELSRRRDELWAEVEGPLVSRVKDALLVLEEMMYLDEFEDHCRFRHPPELRLAAARIVMSVASRSLSAS